MEAEKPKAESFDEWCVVELFGHKKFAGRVTERIIAGAAFIRIDVFPTGATEPIASPFYNPSAVYGMTPVSEEVARGFTDSVKPEPVARWQLPADTGGVRPRTYERSVPGQDFDVDGD